MSGFNTSLLHDGVDDYPNGATLVPIYQSSAFKHESAEEINVPENGKCYLKLIYHLKKELPSWKKDFQV